ncbi:MAG: catechol-2,3-dioxygenase [Alphaproteobacteria bacterium]|jgi:catechol-2,3-dioxygenase
MDTIDPRDYRPEKTAPVRSDAPGTVTNMPSPREIHHVHIYSDVNFDKMVDFYQWLFNGEIIRTNPGGLTFISYDDHDHRVVIIPRKGWGTKPERPIGISHNAFAYASLGELLYIYSRMKERGYAPDYTVNHGNSTSFYYRDPDGNTVETMMDNYTSRQTQDYKRHFQWSEHFGQMAEANFDPDKMLALYESGVPDSDLLDREKVREFVRGGQL